MTQTAIVEVTIFKLKSDIQEADFLEADAAFTEALRSVGGFISRQLLKGENHLWVDMIQWQRLEDAQRSGATIASKPTAQAFIQMLDGSDNQMFYLMPTRTYS